MMPRRAGAWLALLIPLALAGCGTAPVSERAPHTPHSAYPAEAAAGPVLPPAGSGRGAYYQDDGPGQSPPPKLEQVPDAQVRIEASVPRANRSYVVFGKTYTPITDDKPFSERGMASWYGKKFHGQRTSSGEMYDMYKMTAAHPTLPIPSYARLTSIVSGKQVVVRINDRGPFHAGRIIDVSYTAALKLGLLDKGTHEVLVERVLPAEIKRMLANPQAPMGGSPEPLPVLPVLPLLAAMPVEAAAAASPATLSYYLQLGAFAIADNAQAIRLQFMAQSSTLGTIEVVHVGALYRIYSAPFASREEALRAAQTLPDGLNVKPIIVLR